MEELKNIGYIYKITNLVNGKVYIGQTSQTIELRWKEHLKSKKENKYPLYKSMNKYGIENFIIEEIEKCEIDDLNEREIYWISFYDSYHNGYNLTLGGDGRRKYILDEQEVINKYSEFKSAEKVAQIYNCSSSIIFNILNKNNIHIESQSERGFSIDRYSLDGILLETHKSLHQAGIWIKENCVEFKDKSSINISYHLKCLLLRNKNSFAGYKWNMNSITEQNKLDFLEKRKSYRERMGENYSGKYYENSKVICPICHKNMKDIKSFCCINCKSLESSKKFKEKFEEKISKQTLMQLVREKSFIDIGKIYGVSDNTIKKWCKKYLIPYRKEDINNISDEDWEKECKLTKEEYKSKYCLKKEIISEDKVINAYKEFGSFRKVSELYHMDVTTVKKILEKNNVEIKISNKSFLSENEFLCRVDTNTNEIIEFYSTYKEAIEFIQKTNSSKYEVIRKRLRKACQNQSNAYGYYWRKELKKDLME